MYSKQNSLEAKRSAQPALPNNNDGSVVAQKTSVQPAHSDQSFRQQHLKEQSLRQSVHHVTINTSYSSSFPHLLACSAIPIPDTAAEVAPPTAAPGAPWLYAEEEEEDFLGRLSTVLAGRGETAAVPSSSACRRLLRLPLLRFLSFFAAASASAVCDVSSCDFIDRILQPRKVNP